MIRSQSPPPSASMELLAPAGTIFAFEAALQEGADAVYIGAPGLNARALSRDFTFGEIKGMTDHAHALGKKIYVAMNSLMKESEVRLALESLQRFAAIAPDALIIQDMGLLHLIRRYFPGLKLHASTLTTINTSMGARFFHGLGFERVVLARELSLEEICGIHAHSGVELEIFIHGAMCFSYSGLCRFSSLHGGKSSLRGQCVQPCRRRYDWLASGKSGNSSHGGKRSGYFFSMNDLCGIDVLAAIRDTGVVSLKIEGRLKSVEYVRNTVRAYRLALDALDQPPQQQAAILTEAHRCLDAAMGRKRSSGFFISGQEDRLILPHLAGSSGEMVGKITRIDQEKTSATSITLRLQVTLLATVEQGDRLRLYEERSGNRKSFTLRTMEVKGKQVEQAHKGQTVTVVVDDGEAAGLHKPSNGLLFRVDLRSRADKNHSGLASKIRTTKPPKDHPDLVRQQLADWEHDDPRRPQAGSRSQGRGRNGERDQGKTVGKVPQWWLKVASLEGARQRFPFTVSRFVLDLTPENAAEALQVRSKPGTLFSVSSVVWALPFLVREDQLPPFQQMITALRRRGAGHFQISHISQQAFFAALPENSDLPPLKIYGNYSCNVLNTPALQEYADAGLSGVQFSLETDRATLMEVLSHRVQPREKNASSGIQIGLYVFGRPPLFSARLNAPHFQGQRTFASARGERFYLERRSEAVYAFSHTAFSLLPHTEELSRLGIDYFVVDVSHGHPKKTAAEVIALLSARGELPAYFSGNYTGILS